MDLSKGLIMKTWKRCTSFGKNSSGHARGELGKKSKSCPCMESSGRKRRVAPQGCFSVYVGPQKQRFVVKTEYVNHPLFKLLLEEAELEYGYSSEGPLALPCTVDFFLKVLVEMDGRRCCSSSSSSSSSSSTDDDQITQKGCSFSKTRTSSSYRLILL